MKEFGRKLNIYKIGIRLKLTQKIGMRLKLTQVNSYHEERKIRNKMKELQEK